MSHSGLRWSLDCPEAWEVAQHGGRLRRGRWSQHRGRLQLGGRLQFGGRSRRGAVQVRDHGADRLGGATTRVGAGGEAGSMDR